jgi:hypothetical protein
MTVSPSTNRINGSVTSTGGASFLMDHTAIGKLLIITGGSSGGVSVDMVTTGGNAIFDSNVQLMLTNNTIGKNLNCDNNGQVGGSSNGAQHLNGQCSGLY